MSCEPSGTLINYGAGGPGEWRIALDKEGTKKHGNMDDQRARRILAYERLTALVLHFAH